MQVGAKKTLYDILEVSPQASQETIRIAFDRLTKKHLARETIVDPALNPDVAYNLVKDAFFTLGNPTQRDAYDAAQASRRMADQTVSMEPAMAPGYSFVAKGLFALALLFAIVYYFNQQKALELQKEQLLLEQKRMEAEVLAEQQRMEAARAADELRAVENARRQELAEAAQRQREMERVRAYADQNSRSLQYAEERAKREEQNQLRQEEARRRQDAYERERNQAAALREAERLKAAARQLEYERSGRPGGGAIPR